MDPTKSPYKAKLLVLDDTEARARNRSLTVLPAQRHFSWTVDDTDARGQSRPSTVLLAQLG